MSFVGHHARTTLWFILGGLVGHGHASFDALKSAADSVKDKVDKSADQAGHRFDRTEDWAKATWGDAADAQGRAKDRVKQKSGELGQTLEDSSKDNMEKANEMWTTGYPTCNDLMYAVRDQANATFASTIDEAFRLQQCLANVTTDACFIALRDLWARVIFEAMWFPINAGLSTAAPGAKTAASVVKPHAKAALQEPLRKASEPVAKGTQDVMIAADLDTSLANEVVLQAKQEVVDLKDDMLRVMEANSADLCQAVGAETNWPVGSASLARSRQHPLFVLVLTISWLGWVVETRLHLRPCT